MILSFGAFGWQPTSSTNKIMFSLALHRLTSATSFTAVIVLALAIGSTAAVPRSRDESSENDDVVCKKTKVAIL
jgi:hypothetical protein